MDGRERFRQSSWSPNRTQGARKSRCKAQSNVVGMALLLGVTVISMGTLTASIGAVVEENAKTADSTRVATSMAETLAPIKTTGMNQGHLAFTEGSLYTVDRDLRILEGEDVHQKVTVDALIFEAEDQRVTFIAGAVIRGRGPGADVINPPPITASRDPDILIIGAPRLDSTIAVAGTGGTKISLRSNVSHQRIDLGQGEYTVALETTTPGPLEESFIEQGSAVTRKDLDGDGIQSVVADFPERREAYLVIHHMRLEVEP